MSRGPILEGRYNELNHSRKTIHAFRFIGSFVVLNIWIDCQIGIISLSNIADEHVELKGETGGRVMCLQDLSEALVGITIFFLPQMITYEFARNFIQQLSKSDNSFSSQ